MAKRWVGRDGLQGESKRVLIQNIIEIFFLDGAASTVNGCFYSYATVVQSPEIRYCSVFIHISPISKIT